MSARSTDRAAPSAPAPDWSAILVEAVNKAGVISQAYSRFWNYSIGNQLLALMQCLMRRIEPGPINTYPGWRKLGRYVRKGEKALVLCMPVTVKRNRGDPPPEDAIAEDTAVRGGDGAERQRDVIAFTRFIYRPHWFVLAQTEGKEYSPVPLPDWDEQVALERLNIQRVAFRHTNGNAQGYAAERTIAISPIAFAPQRTLFHELAHIVLGHTEELRRMDDDDTATPTNLREVEAECVALICCQCLRLGGEQFSRGYIQHWLGKEPIPQRSAQRIFKAADQILKAGYPTASNAETAPLT